MKYAVLAITIVFVLTGMAYALDKSQIPIQCEGKNIHCMQHNRGTCFAIYCPPTKTYDKEGNLISESDGCNPCSYTITEECFCDDFRFVLESFPIRR